MSVNLVRTGGLQWAVVLALLAGCAAPAAAGERYFGMLIGSQTEPWRARTTHTFGVIVRATGEGPDWGDYDLVVHAGSWLPATGEIRPLAPSPEQGRNFTLAETLAIVLGTGQKIQQWGPYEIRPVSYLRGLLRISELESGQLRYRAITGLDRSNIRNCYHAVADLTPDLTRWDLPGVHAGFVNTEKIACDFYRNGVYLTPEVDHAWLNARLGLDQVPMCRRRFDPRMPIRPSAYWQQLLASAPPVLAVEPPPHLVLPGRRSAGSIGVPLVVPGAVAPGSPAPGSPCAAR